MAAKVGFEPTTNRLTADRSTAELLGNFFKNGTGCGNRTHARPSSRTHRL